MLAVIGGKGGCGKTTTTACLARSLAAAGAAPVAVDADSDMPDLHHVAETPGEPGVERIPEDGVRAVARPSPALPGVRVVAAGTGEGLLDAAPLLRDLDEPVLLDAPAGASPDAVVPLRIADRAVVVTTPSRESLEDAAKSAAVARALDTEVVGSVVVRSDGGVDPSRLLECPTLAHVPAVSDPLADPSVSDTYDGMIVEAGQNI